jgi:hypothetical protein
MVIVKNRLLRAEARGCAFVTLLRKAVVRKYRLMSFFGILGDTLAFVLFSKRSSVDTGTLGPRETGHGADFLICSSF